MRTAASIRRLGLASVIVLGLFGGFPECAVTSSKPQAAQGTLPQSGDQPSENPVAVLTEAEKIALLQRIIEANRQEFRELTARRDDHREDQQAQKKFQPLDDQLKNLEKAFEKARNQGETGQVEVISKEIGKLKKPWQLAQERFNLDLRARKLINERIEILESTLKHDEERLQELLGNKVPTKPAQKTEPGKAEDSASPTESKPSAAKARETAAAETKTGGERPKPAPTTLPGLPGIPQATPTKQQQPVAGVNAANEQPKVESQPPSKELLKAEKMVETKSVEVKKNEQRLISLEERLQNVDRSLELERELMDIAKLQADNARQTRELLEEQPHQETRPGAPTSQPKQPQDQIAEADHRLQEAVREIKRRQQRQEELIDERNLILDAMQLAVHQTKTTKTELQKAQKRVEFLEIPLTLQHVLEWVWNHGPIMVATLLGMLILYWLMGRLSDRTVKLVAGQGMRGSKAERESRADTLVGVLHNAATLVIFGGGTLIILDEAGIPIGPLLGGAAVVGLAVAFGAQNLIKDYFYGFMILLENQYKLNDVVKIGDHAGQVELITLRMTALRDEEGSLHFIPNGGITSVVNMSHGWSRALFEVRIAFTEDIDRVIEVIESLGKEMRKDPTHRFLILEDLTMLGVDAMGDSAVVIKFYFKTSPLQQWTVKREFLRRLKKQFDEMGKDRVSASHAD